MEVRRNGVLIGTSGTGFGDYRRHIESPWMLNYNWDYSPVLRDNLSNLDIKNGDEITFIFNIRDAGGTSGTGINKDYFLGIVRSINRKLIIKQVYYKAELISR